MKVLEFLDENSARYEVTRHQPTYSAQQMAAAEHVPGMEVAKPVVVRADDKYYMCVLPACRKVDMDALKEDIGAGQVELAGEDEMSKLFADCQLGAEPPFGNLYGLETLMDQSLEKDDQIVFQAGTHEQAIKMATDDYKELVGPHVLRFSYPDR
ncbi:MAG: aminoacyl-tRNA deacylase [Planctomycetota bacterium]|jgi:Ala-tRNA(Pro) deacylase